MTKSKILTMRSEVKVLGTHFADASRAREDSQMKTNRNTGRLRTIIGDLVVSIVDAALEVTRNERRAYRLTG
jgi:hypothetical protein